ncbi:unnamed protein product [Angiostrongylus costaricensis]|uniref:Bestrophin homolog n=1 Tax=Angiostrongylus costaricensis TaxID=334426 RepID=A0A0R3PZW8_ANGCS|nr:unnamed protein product [Angiostrongylus costaricensis]
MGTVDSNYFGCEEDEGVTTLAEEDSRGRLPVTHAISRVAYHLDYFWRQTSIAGFRALSFQSGDVKVLNESILFLVDVINNDIFPAVD